MTEIYIIWSFINAVGLGILMWLPNIKKIKDEAWDAGYDAGYKQGKRYGYEEEILNRLHQQYKD